MSGAENRSFGVSLKYGTSKKLKCETEMIKGNI